RFRRLMVTSGGMQNGAVPVSGHTAGCGLRYFIPAAGASTVHERQQGDVKPLDAGHVVRGERVAAAAGVAVPGWLPAECPDDRAELLLGERRVEHLGGLAERERHRYGHA